MEQLKDILFSSGMILIFIGCLFLYIRAIIDIHKRKFSFYREKSMWLTIVIAAPLLGSIYYFAIKKQQANRQIPG